MRVLVLVLSSSPLFYLPSPTRMVCAQPGQVPKASNFLSSRPGERVLFSTGTIIWPPALSLPWPGGHHKHIEALTIFTQQAFNDSRQSLSLLNTKMSLTRKTILQNRMALDVIIASRRGTCAVLQTVLYVHTRESLLINSPGHK